MSVATSMASRNHDAHQPRIKSMNALNHLYPTLMPELGDVAVFDDFVPEVVQRNVLRLVRRPIWAYGWKSIKQTDRYGFWHAHFAGGDEQNQDDCSLELGANANAAPIHALWQHLSSSCLRGHIPVRVYANAHTYGVEGYVHVDSTDEVNHFTTIYYAHGAWDNNWAGETLFYSSDASDITRAVYPKPGRIAVFRGATPHVARAVSRECPELRISVVFKTRLA